MWVKYHGVNIDVCNSALEIIIVSGISEKASTPRQCSKSFKNKVFKYRDRTDLLPVTIFSTHWSCRRLMKLEAQSFVGLFLSAIGSSCVSQIFIALICQCWLLPCSYAMKS